ncbi:MAG: 3-methyl-2-oxobutanoate hydroxymethyltransferase [Armatimonadetes bacterium]|nr:3-methyl-2-oxobutanoate hydroxymethyltransferase [Armatimonadota bacterium]
MAANKTAPALRAMKSKGEKIVSVTAYDFTTGAIADSCDVDFILVGDSLGMVIQGHDTTIPVTIADIIYHTKNVARGLRRAFLVADMPFMSYADPGQALENSVLLMQEGGAMMIKLEGGEGQLDIVEHLFKFCVGHFGILVNGLGMRLQALASH